MLGMGCRELGKIFNEHLVLLVCKKKKVNTIGEKFFFKLRDITLVYIYI